MLKLLRSDPWQADVCQNDVRNFPRDISAASSTERKRPTQRNPLVPFISIAKPSLTSRRSSMIATLISGGGFSVGFAISASYIDGE